MNFCSRVWNENWLDGNREARKSLCRVFVSLEKVTEQEKTWVMTVIRITCRVWARTRCDTESLQHITWWLQVLFVKFHVYLVKYKANRSVSKSSFLMMWCATWLTLVMTGGLTLVRWWHLWGVDEKGCSHWLGDDNGGGGVITLVRWWQVDSHLWGDDRGIHTCEVMTLVRCWWEGLFTLIKWWELGGGLTLVRWWQGNSHL